MLDLLQGLTYLIPNSTDTVVLHYHAATGVVHCLTDLVVGDPYNASVIINNMELTHNVADVAEGVNLFDNNYQGGQQVTEHFRGEERLHYNFSQPLKNG